MKYLLILLLAACFAFPALAQEYSDPNQSVPTPGEFSKARVIETLAEGAIDENFDQQHFQTVKVVLISGSEKGREMELTTTNYFPKAAPAQHLEKNDIIIVSKTLTYEGEPLYQISDRYRLDRLWWALGFFVVLALWLGRKRGLTSLFGLAFSILVLGTYIVPRILAGDNSFLTVLIGSVLIATISLYLAHGFKRQTSIALASTILTLGLAIIMAVVFVNFSKLFGLGSEDAHFLIASGISPDLRGLLLGGIIIGTLGVLDDITTAQTAVVEELRRANPALSRSELYKRGLSVGHEHIASLINTLVLAYAGASLPIFLLFALNKLQPAWTIFNSEFVAEEIIRTLVGSSTLILAVPISTFLAAYFLTRPGAKLPSVPSHSHHHH